MTDKIVMVPNKDGVTFRFPGNMQTQLSVEDQKRCGLIASTNFSITEREVKRSTGR